MAPFCNSHVNIISHHQISPVLDSPLSQISLPLTFFDIPWLLFPCSHPLFFYHSPNFSLPALKHSLSLALRHFPPLSGKLIAPPEHAKPKIVYDEFDSVLLVVAESSANFGLLTSNCPKNVDLFRLLVPKPSNLFSVQVTVFPDSGVCIGFSLNQVAADQRTFSLFLKSWALICKQITQGGSISAIENKPSFNRTVIKDSNGLEQILFDEFRNLKSFPQKPKPKPAKKESVLVRATFVLSLAQMDKIKRKIIDLCQKSNQTQPFRLSPYVLASAFIWVSLIRANKGINKTEVQKQGMLCFGFIAGGITRLKNCRVPTNYFGNCVAFGTSTAMENDILSENGIVFAAKAVAETIAELDNDILGGAERWVGELERLFGNEDSIVVVGSPKVELYKMDFGWGMPKKVEDVCIDSMCTSMGVKAVSFNESKDSKGGFEIGVVLTQLQMDAFTSIFYQGLRDSM